ncbi:uncharacterized protein [Aquarana catesbeiana]|uniref:uncharacterized protein n=1 Tax=Aquarana catesbeiana TaxID=8400 RepID=UPI003CC9FEB3
MAGFLSQTIHVWQTPVIWATEGDSITLPCYYRIDGENPTIGSYKWYRHKVRSEVEISENDKYFSGRLSRVNNDQFIHGRSADITLHSVELSDSGMFYCEVSFQIGQQISGVGNGTFLNVTASANKGSRPKASLSWYIHGGFVGGVLLLSLLSAVVYCVYTKQEKEQRKERRASASRDPHSPPHGQSNLNPQEGHQSYSQPSPGEPGVVVEVEEAQEATTSARDSDMHLDRATLRLCIVDLLAQQRKTDSIKEQVEEVQLTIKNTLDVLQNL